MWVLYTVALIGLTRVIDDWDIRFAIFLLVPVLYRYIFYQCFGCFEKTNRTVGAAANTAGTQDETLNQPLIDSNSNTGTTGEETQTTTAVATPPPRRGRYPFLDNVKVFLTAVVVTHHIESIFGASGGTIIKVESSLAVFTFILNGIGTINSGYFMPLFFFISAFFVPSSYAKGREKFLRSKKKRILFPALVCTFVLYPIGILFSVRYTTGKWVYKPMHYGPTWFLYWLLLLDWVYMSIVDSTADSDSDSAGDDHTSEIEIERTRRGQEEKKMSFPSTWTRLFYSVTLCGLVLGSFTKILPPNFYAMWIEVCGTWTANFFMFYAGVLAKKHGWLEKDLVEQLDIPLYVFFTMVLFEFLIYYFCLGTVNGDVNIFPQDSALIYFVMSITGGAFTVDMCLAVLIVFQRWFNYETKWSKMLARSAYCVYLIHTLVLLTMTIIYLEIYRLVFGSGEGTEVGRILGGFIFVNVVSHAVLWPLSYALTRMPILRDII